MPRFTRNIVLIGFMGSGKSSVGALLSERLGRDFLDTDDLIESTTGRVIADIFTEDGETAFRDLESEAVREAASQRGVIISTGGGAALRQENIDALKSSGTLVLLDASAESIYARVAHEAHRPLLRVEDPLGRIREMLSVRRPYYEQADIVVSTDAKSVEEIADRIIAAFQLIP